MCRLHVPRGTCHVHVSCIRVLYMYRAPAPRAHRLLRGGTMPSAAPRLSRSSFITVPGMPAADLDELQGALRALGSDVDTRVESPGPQMMLEWFLPAAIHW